MESEEKIKTVPTTVFLGGSPKAGTSSMWYYLSQHPNIYGGEEKEIHFFRGNNWEKGVNWYLEKYKNYGGEKQVLDGSHTLITAPSTALERIDKFVGAPKFIFIVRDPIDRLVSTYKFGFKYGQKPYKYFGSFSEWIRDERSKRDIEYGKYYKYISRFAKYFGRNNVKVVLFKNMSKNTSKTVKNLYEYLDVDKNFSPEIKVINSTKHPSRGYHVVSVVQKIIQEVEKKLGVRLRNKITSQVKKILLDVSRKRRIATKKDKRYLIDLYSSDSKKMQNFVQYNLSHWGTID